MGRRMECIPSSALKKGGREARLGVCSTCARFTVSKYVPPLCLTLITRIYFPSVRARHISPSRQGRPSDADTGGTHCPGRWRRRPSHWLSARGCGTRQAQTGILCKAEVLLLCNWRWSSHSPIVWKDKNTRKKNTCKQSPCRCCCYKTRSWYKRVVL